LAFAYFSLNNLKRRHGIQHNDTRQNNIQNDKKKCLPVYKECYAELRNSECLYVERLSAECRGASERVSFMAKCTNVTKADYFWKIQICSPGKSAGCNFFLRNLCKRSREIELAAKMPKMPEFVKCHVWESVKFVTCRSLKMFSTSNFCGTTSTTKRRTTLSITTPRKKLVLSYIIVTQHVRPY